MKCLICSPQIHKGFLQQFESVTSDTKGDQYNLTKLVQSLSGGVAPAQINCYGHSLGAGLATLCGLWATLTVSLILPKNVT